MRGGLSEAEEILKKNQLSTAVGDEGGFAPDIKGAREVLELMEKAVEQQDISLEQTFVLP